MREHRRATHAKLRDKRSTAQIIRSIVAEEVQLVKADRRCAAEAVDETMKLDDAGPVMTIDEALEWAMSEGLLTHEGYVDFWTSMEEELEADLRAEGKWVLVEFVAPR